MINKKMLSRLFEDSDINIPVTIFSEPQKKVNGYAYKSAWYQTISDTLGETLKNHEQNYHFQITSMKGKNYTLHCTGAFLMAELHKLFECKAPLSIRIDLLEDSDSSWVIILKEDL